MTEKIKNYLGAALIMGILALAAAAISYVVSYARLVDPASARSFAVAAEGKAVAVPDVAQFSFSVITEGGRDLARLQQDNTQKANRVIEFVKNQGVEAKDIRTTAYNVLPRYQNFDCPPVLLPTFPEREIRACPPPEIAGYTITQNVTVKVRDFSKVGPILSGVVDQGANQVSQLNFTVDDRTAVENQARAEAISKAKAKAEGLAQAGDFRLGKLLSIDEGFYPAPVYDEFGRGFGGTAPAAPQPSALSPVVEPGSQEIVVNVTLRYEIK